MGGLSSAGKKNCRNVLYQEAEKDADAGCSKTLRYKARYRCKGHGARKEQKRKMLDS
jgi:hypothetical protein